MARKEKELHYLYKITNTKNGKYYIGMHSTDDINDGYFGSGKLIRNSIRSHGKGSHKKEILSFFENREELKNAEKKLITEDVVNDPLCMNLKSGGEGGLSTDEHKMKFKNSQKLASSRGVDRIKYLYENDKEWVKKTLKNMSNAIKLAYLEKRIDRSKVSLPGEKNPQFGTIWVYNLETGEVKKIKNSEIAHHLDNGWEKGRNGKIQSGSANSQFGTAWIFNESSGEIRKIKNTEIDNYFNNGWRRGRK